MGERVLQLPEQGGRENIPPARDGVEQRLDLLLVSVLQLTRTMRELLELLRGERMPGSAGPLSTSESDDAHQRRVAGLARARAAKAAKRAARLAREG